MADYSKEEIKTLEMASVVDSLDLSEFEEKASEERAADKRGPQTDGPFTRISD